MLARIDNCISHVKYVPTFGEVLGSFGEVARQLFTAFCLSFWVHL